MLANLKNKYEPETDGRIYCLSYELKQDLFINFDERELVDLVEILVSRRKKTAIKLVALISDVGKHKNRKNLLLESIKEKCLLK